jgi:ATP-dependent Lon protease
MFNREKQEMKRVPMMPVRDMVIFPQQMTPFIVGREASVRALEEALAGDKKIFLSTQHDASVDDPKPEEIYAVGTLANIVQSVKLPDGNIKVLVEGVERARALTITAEEGFFRASVRILNARVEPSPQVEQTVQKVTGLYEQFIKLSQSLNYDTMIAAARVDDPSRLSDTIAANLQLPVDEKQDLLETVDPVERLNRIGDILEIELEKLNVDRNINTRVKRQMERAQKEYYLNEKLKAIQKELGRGEKSEIDELKKKIDSAGMSKEVHEKAIQELKRLELMPPMSAESTVSRNYLDWLLAVPWKKKSKEIRDILAAEKILNEEHYGLEKIKDRILEFLAVRQLVKNPKGSILCFVGPPGVGKTSLAMSIGHATGRKFVRVSLGGVRDEAEIRGHRRTYIGALPGQIIQMMKKAGTVNPIFVLDEVDKMSTDFRGDPSAALMEVLDPELNHAFTDHYLDVEYDLSKVMFVCTANLLHTIPQPLQDRMEVLRIPGYTEQEKLQIAKRFLVKRQREATGLQAGNLSFTDEGLLHIIRHYTQEAGVRNLEREIQNISRKLARRVVTEGQVAGVKPEQTDELTSDVKAEVKAETRIETKTETKTEAKSEEKIALKSNVKVEIVPANVNDYLGVLKYREFWLEKHNEIGLTTGLAWTEVGGTVLTTEATLMEGKGRLTLTGKLGDVMQESAQAAMSYIRSRSHTFGLAKDFYRNIDIHVHVPEGAIPKDGPSAGITICNSIVSALTRIPVRRDVTMTGEITLRGKVLPIGGVKEKLLAAHRMGLRTVLLPKDNEKDLAEIPQEILSSLTIRFVETMDEVLQVALERPIVPIEHPAVAPVAEPFVAGAEKDTSLTN